MANWITIGTVDEIAEGTMKKFVVEGRELLVVNTGGTFFAAANKCPHLGGDLSKGKLEGTVVTCPRHGSRFDVRDGSIVQWLKGPGLVKTLAKIVKPEKQLQTFDVKIEGTSIAVQI